jgi:hypothetical protein
MNFYKIREVFQNPSILFLFLTIYKIVLECIKILLVILEYKENEL